MAHHRRFPRITTSTLKRPRYTHVLYYSRKADEFGTSLNYYLDQQTGKEVLITGIFKWEDRHMYKWVDKQIVGRCNGVQANWRKNIRVSENLRVQLS